MGGVCVRAQRGRGREEEGRGRVGWGRAVYARGAGVREVCVCGRAVYAGGAGARGGVAGQAPALIERRTERIFDSRGNNWQQARSESRDYHILYTILHY